MRLYDGRASDAGGDGPEEGLVAGLGRAGFDRLYQLEQRRLWLLAAGLTGRAADADDVLQQALMLAFRKREFFRSSGNSATDSPAFAAWVGRFVRNVAANYQRARRRQAKRQAQGLDPAVLGKTVLERQDVEPAALAGTVPLGTDLFDDRVLRALERVKPVSRACLLMNVVGGLTHAEIAVSLRLKENTVASHIRRARVRMRELLEPGSAGA